MILVAFFDELFVSREISTRWNVVFNVVNVGLNLTIFLFHTKKTQWLCGGRSSKNSLREIVFRQNTDNSYKE